MVEHLEILVDSDPYVLVKHRSPSVVSVWTLDRQALQGLSCLPHLLVLQSWRHNNRKEDSQSFDYQVCAYPLQPLVKRRDCCSPEALTQQCPSGWSTPVFLGTLWILWVQLNCIDQSSFYHSYRMTILPLPCSPWWRNDVLNG